MMRTVAAIAVALVLPLSVPGQDNPAAEALQRRIRLDPEDAFHDPLDAAEDVAAAVGRIGFPAASRSSIGLEMAASVVLEHLAHDRYAAALAEFRHVLQEDSARLALPPANERKSADTLTSRDAQALAHERLLGLPPSVLNRYRQRIDADAARLLALGVSNRDPAPLRRLVRDFRASEQAAPAFAVLGDLAFERGDFEQALDWWRQIVPLPSRMPGNPRGAAVHVPGVDVVRVHAKQVLALIFASRPEAVRERDAFAELYPLGRGTLAGREAPFREILSHWLSHWASLPQRDADEPWSTFAGAPSRNRVVAEPPSPRLWVDGPAWRTPLPPLQAKEPPPVWISATRSLAIPHMPFHPAIGDGQVLISDGHTIRSFDLLTGRPRFRAGTAAPFVRRDDLQTPSHRAFGLTLVPGRAFARLGVRPGDPEPRRLVAVDTAPGNPINRVVWTADANVEAPEAYFETDPLIANERVFIGLIHHGEQRTPRFLASYDLSGRAQWQVRLADFAEADARRPAPRPMLAATGRAIICATDAGVVVAVDPWTGRRLWAFRYPTVDAALSPRGPSSCLVADGRVFLAPSDSAHLYALDADTGRVLWERPWLKPPSDVVVGPPEVSEVVDLLGVVDDRLIFTDRFRLQAIDARTGWTLEWQQPVRGRLPGQGRGLLAGPWVFWPTADPDVTWRAVVQASGSLRISPTEGDGSPQYYEATVLRHLPAGNVAYGQGCLVVAAAKELLVFAPPKLLVPALERDPRARVEPAKLFRLAMAQLDAGRSDDARRSLADLERSLPVVDREGWTHLIRERTAPPTKAKPASAPKAKPAASTDPLAAPSAPASGRVGKLIPSWGPVPGNAPPIEGAPGSKPDDIVAVLDGPDIAFVGLRGGEELFRRRRSFDAVEWLGRHGPLLVVAGPDGIEAFDVDARRPAWRFDAPALAKASWQLVDDRPRRIVAPQRLTGFQFEGSQLIAFEGRSRLIALDAATGTTVADHRLDEIGPLDGGRVFRLASFGGMALHRQLHDDFASAMAARRVVESDGVESDVREDRRRFVALGAGRWLVGEAQGGVALRHGDEIGVPRIGEEGVKYRPAWPTSLTGAPAHVFSRGDAMLALIPRNQGFELIRLKERPFEPLWSVPPYELREGFDVLDAVVGEAAVYLAHAGELQARSLATGAIVWRTPLPSASGPWKVERFGGGLLVWARSSAGLPAVSGPVDPFTAAVTLYAGRRGIGSVPILLVDAGDGSIGQRIDAPHDGGPAFVDVRGNRLVVSSGNAVRSWLGVGHVLNVPEPARTKRSPNAAPPR